MGPRSLAAQLADHCTECFLGASNQSLSAILWPQWVHWWLSGAQNTTESLQSVGHLLAWSAPGDGLSETSWRLDLVPVPGYAEQNTRHTPRSAANQRPGLRAADQWGGRTAAGSDVPSVTCLAVSERVCLVCTHWRPSPPRISCLSTISDFRPKTDPKSSHSCIE